MQPGHGPQHDGLEGGQYPTAPAHRGWEGLRADSGGATTRAEPSVLPAGSNDQDEPEATDRGPDRIVASEPIYVVHTASARVAAGPAGAYFHHPSLRGEFGSFGGGGGASAGSLFLRDSNPARDSVASSVTVSSLWQPRQLSHLAAATGLGSLQQQQQEQAQAVAMGSSVASTADDGSMRRSMPLLKMGSGALSVANVATVAEGRQGTSRAKRHSVASYSPAFPHGAAAIPREAVPSPSASAARAIP